MTMEKVVVCFFGTSVSVEVFIWKGQWLIGSESIYYHDYSYIFLN